jgi:uncharacterized protein
MAGATLIDRERERDELRRLATSADRRLAILYGRRQVGKTFLLSRTWEDRRFFYFVAADTTSELNKQDLLRELSTWSGQSLNLADYPTWRTIFRLFVDLTAREPLVVVLDEFQYLLRSADDPASQLVAVWDRDAVGHPLTLVLSGSEVATMEHLLSGGQPLFGRANWSARLHPFDYRDAAHALPGRAPRDAARFYGIFGGTPRYLTAIGPGEPLDAAAIRTLVSPRGEVHLQLLTLIEQERGIRDPAEYRAILSAIAGGATEINEISQKGGLERQAPAVRRVLRILEDLDIVGHERNFAAPEKAPHRYFLADNAVAFWHRFIVPNRSRLATTDPASVWAEAMSPYLNDQMGLVFERIVAQAYARQHGRWGLPGASNWASGEGRDRNRRSIEIDVVAQLDDGRMLTGEIKWSSQPRGFELHNELQRNLDDLGHSGQGWAREAQKGIFLYVSAAGFTPEFQRWAATQPSVHLLVLDDLYAD